MLSLLSCFLSFSLSLSLCVCVCLCRCLSLSLSPSLVYVCLCASLSLSLSLVYVCLCAFLSLSLSLSLALSVSLPALTLSQATRYMLDETIDLLTDLERHAGVAALGWPRDIVLQLGGVLERCTETKHRKRTTLLEELPQMERILLHAKYAGE